MIWRGNDKFMNYGCGIAAYSLHVVKELADIEFTLSRFDFGDQGLRPLQNLGEFHLGEPLLFPNTFQDAE
jgi:hypothetical protein